MAWLASILRRAPVRPSLRSALNAAIAAYLVFIGVEAIGGLLQPARETVSGGAGLALFGTPGNSHSGPDLQRIPVGIPPDLRELRQTYKILGIICRDQHDRSVFVRDLTSGDERIYRAGDILNGDTLSEIHPSFIVLTRGSSRMVLNLFSQEPQTGEESSDG